MTNQTPQFLLQGWRGLYSAALFETDKNRIPDRIADAEKAIVARARELFSACADTIEEHGIKPSTVGLALEPRPKGLASPRRLGKDPGSWRAKR